MHYGQNYGEETLSKEYKQFTFNHGGLTIDIKEAEELVKSSKWVFNKMIIESLKNYMSVYLPKYTSAFLDVLSDTNHGEFYIGISDNGTVDGIPYQGDLDIESITAEFNKIISQRVDDSINLLHTSIKFEIIPIKYEAKKISLHTPMYSEYLKYINKFNKKKLEFEQRVKDWKIIQRRYGKRLVDIVNDTSTRHELELYIRRHDPSNPVIKLLQNSKFKLETKLHDEINELKNNPNETYYWVCKFKDEYLDEIHKKKPINRMKSEILSFLEPMCILMKISNMIPWWMQKNKNMKLYVIKISYTKNRNNNEIYYYDSMEKKRCYRTINEERPCCLPL